MNTFDLKNAKKISYMVDTVFVVYVVAFIGLYWYMDVTYMIYHSIPTLILYSGMYFLIAKGKLYEFVLGAYFVLTAYMGATTVCLGVEYGFQLYIMSMIPIAFYVEYMAFRLHGKVPMTLWLCLMMVTCYLVCAGYAIYFGPVYHHDNNNLKMAIFSTNSLCVFSFLIVYTRLLLGMILQFQTQLLDMAHNDKLTGLYNRHYMVEYLNQMEEDKKPYEFMAMIDIDHFKSINDTYGHDGGDAVLRQLSQMMQELCKDCTLARWGGEEFLLVANQASEEDLPELLRKKVEETPFPCGGQEIKVTITIGVEDYHEGRTWERCIQAADLKLYQGKNGGRNMVVRS